MKIKTNYTKETITIKGITAGEFALLYGLLSHVRLGQEYDGGASEAAFNFLEAIDAADLSVFNFPDIDVVAEPSDTVEGICVTLYDPVIEVYAN